MGYPGQPNHPEVQAAIDDAVRRTRAFGRAPGVLSTPATATHYLSLGAQFIYVSLASLLEPGSREFLGTIGRA